MNMQSGAFSFRSLAGKTYFDKSFRSILLLCFRYLKHCLVQYWNNAARGPKSSVWGQQI